MIHFLSALFFSLPFNSTAIFAEELFREDHKQVLISETREKYREHEEFMGNDNDNGLFNLCLFKFKIHHPIYPDEINLYNKRGVQVEHLNIDKTKINWNLLNKIPFQCRRIKPN